MQNRRPSLEGALSERRSSRSHGGQAAAPAGTRSPNPCPLAPFEDFVGWRSRANHCSRLILTLAQLQRSRRKFRGGGPTSRDSPGLEAQKPGLGVRGPDFGHPGSPRTHRLRQQEAAFERAEEGARRQQGAEPGHCPATSGAVCGLRIGLRLCVRGPHSGATSSSLGLTASPSALEGSGNPLCGRRKSGVRLGPGTHPRLPRLQHLQSSSPPIPTHNCPSDPAPPTLPPSIL